MKLRGKHLVMMLLLAAFSFSAAGDLIAQQQPGASTTAEDWSKTKGIKKWWDFTEKAEEFQWPLIFNFIIGVVLIIKKIVDLYLDRRKAAEIYKLQFGSFKTVEQILGSVRQNKSMIGELMTLLLKSLHFSPDGSQFNEELAKFISSKRADFSIFQNRMVFWSDTAGALGLLGTVWGMFLTFFKGTMDQQSILSGMGVALVTTIMGLVISLVINFCSTEISSFFDNQMIRIAAITEDLRNWAIKNNAALRPAVAVEPAPPRRVVTAEERPAKRGPSCELTIVSGDGQESEIRQALKLPLTVEVNEIDGHNRRKLSTETVVFRAEDDCGVFENGSNQIQSQTNPSGRARASFTPKQPGTCTIEARCPRFDAEPVRFTARTSEPKKREPGELRLKSGNNQSGPAGSRLAKPLVAEVLDEQGVPVPGCAVEFRVEIGDGVFADKQTSNQVRTNDAGLASVEYRLGPEPGFNSVKAAAEGLPKKTVTFQILGQ
jgi:biopolymer transport protein ExbB/TolQ